MIGKGFVLFTRATLC